MRRLSVLLSSTALIAFAASALAAGEPIGIAASVDGAVSLKRAGTTIVVTSGTPIERDDLVTTGDRGSLQILLKDETVFTVGPSSEMVIDAFVYDPGTAGNNKLGASLLKGAARYVTGAVGKANREGVALRLPIGTIGVRGTALAMQAGGAGGDGATVALLGPGPNNPAGVGRGGLAFTPAGGNAPPIEILRAGHGVRFGGGGVAPFVGPLSPVVLAGLNAALAPRPPAGSGGGGGGGVGPRVNDSNQLAVLTRINGEAQDRLQQVQRGVSRAADANEQGSRNAIAAGVIVTRDRDLPQTGLVTLERNGIGLVAGGPPPGLANVAPAEVLAEAINRDINTERRSPRIGSYDAKMIVNYGTRQVQSWDINNIEIPSLGLGGGVGMATGTVAMQGSGGSGTVSSFQQATGPYLGTARGAFVNSGRQAGGAFAHQLVISSAGNTLASGTGILGPKP